MSNMRLYLFLCTSFIFSLNGLLIPYSDDPTERPLSITNQGPSNAATIYNNNNDAADPMDTSEANQEVNTQHPQADQ